MHVLALTYFLVVNAITKLKNLKAIHNMVSWAVERQIVVNAITKLKNLKAIHNPEVDTIRIFWL